jgi:hypothetical protein
MNDISKRRRIRDLIEAQTGVKLDPDFLPTVTDDGIEVCGSVVALVAIADFFGQLGVTVTVDEPDASEPDIANWTCATIPLAALEASLTRMSV